MNGQTWKLGAGLWVAGLLAGCGGGGPAPNNNDNSGIETVLQACQRYIAHLESLTCRDPDFRVGDCTGVDQLSPADLPDYDCLIQNVFCTADGQIDATGAAACYPS